MLRSSRDLLVNFKTICSTPKWLFCLCQQHTTFLLLLLNSLVNYYHDYQYYYLNFFDQQEAYSKLGGTSELTIRFTDSDANTALHRAAEADNLPCLQWLVRQLPNDCLRNIINHENLTPLAAALKVKLSKKLLCGNMVVYVHFALLLMAYFWLEVLCEFMGWWVGE